MQEETDTDGKKEWVPFAKLGTRWAVLNDLSPAATFIAYNYNTPVDVMAFEREAKRILKEVEEECGWMYETSHADDIKGKINYTVWSDVFVCPGCVGEVVFWEVAVKGAGKVLRSFQCPHCDAKLTKRSMERAWETRYDSAIGKTVRQAKQVPVLISYSVEGVKGRFEKVPDEGDLDLIKKIEERKIPYWFPTVHLPDGYNTRQPMRSHGITCVHHFYTKRNLWVLSCLWHKSSKKMKFGLTNFLSRNLTKMNRFVINKHNPSGRINGPMTGTLYIPSEQVEQTAIQL